MKSKLLIATALLCSVFVIAQDNMEVVTLKATSANFTSGDEVVLLVDLASFTTDFDNDYDISKKMGSSESPVVINFYAICNGWNKATKNASQAAEPKADELPFGFESNDLDTEYTITFDILQGAPKWFFYDAQVDSATLITDGGTYVFNQAVGTTDINRFRIQAPEFQVCAYKDYVEITGNEGTDNIVITNMAGDTVVNVAPQMGVQTIDMSGKDAGHYVLTVNGTDYEFCNKPVSNN